MIRVGCEVERRYNFFEISDKRTDFESLDERVSVDLPYRCNLILWMANRV